jgi:hypothetical protein
LSWVLQMLLLELSRLLSGHIDTRTVQTNMFAACAGDLPCNTIQQIPRFPTAPPPLPSPPTLPPIIASQLNVNTSDRLFFSNGEWKNPIGSRSLRLRVPVDRAIERTCARAVIGRAELFIESRRRTSAPILRPHRKPTNVTPFSHRDSDSDRERDDCTMTKLSRGPHFHCLDYRT